MVTRRSEIILNGTNHLWVTQKVYNICLRKLLEMEMTTWLEERRQQKPEEVPREFFRFIMKDSNTGCRRTASQ